MTFTADTMLADPPNLQGVSASSLLGALGLHTCPVVSDCMWVLWSKTQVLIPAWHVFYPQNLLHGPVL